MRILCARWWSEIRVNWLVVAMFEPSFQYTTPFSWHCIHKSSHSQAQYSHFDFIGCCRTGREGANTGKCRKLLSIMDVTTCWNIITISGMPYVLSQLYADEIRAKCFAHVILFFIHDFGICFFSCAICSNITWTACSTNTRQSLFRAREHIFLRTHELILPKGCKFSLIIDTNAKIRVNVLTCVCVCHKIAFML